MEGMVIPPEFDHGPVIGPTVEEFIKLLSGIAFRPDESEEEGIIRL